MKYVVICIFELSMLALMTLTACVDARLPAPVVTALTPDTLATADTSMPALPTIDPNGNIVITFGAPSREYWHYNELANFFNVENPGIRVQLVDVDDLLPEKRDWPYNTFELIHAMSRRADTFPLYYIPL